MRPPRLFPPVKCPCCGNEAPETIEANGPRGPYRCSALVPDGDDASNGDDPTNPPDPDGFVECRMQWSYADQDSVARAVERGDLEDPGGMQRPMPWAVPSCPTCGRTDTVFEDHPWLRCDCGAAWRPDV